MKFQSFLYLIPFFFQGIGIQAQSNQTIRFSRNSDLIYFFKIGPKSDTVSRNQTDRFYFVVRDSLKDCIILDVENGKFEHTQNDSILKFNYLPRMKYEVLFQEKPEEEWRSAQEPVYFVNIRVNGATDYDRSKIRIVVRDKKRNEVLMENIFVYQP